MNSGEDGTCVGRFCRSGVDVHRTGKEQSIVGRECIDCFDDTTIAGWRRFVELMGQHHGVIVSDEAMPERLKGSE